MSSTEKVGLRNIFNLFRNSVFGPNLKFKTLLETKHGSVKPLLNERATKEMIDKVVEMDAEFNNDPTYVKYEKKYALMKIKETIKQTTGMDDIPEEMAEIMLELAGMAAKQKITPEIVMLHKGSVIETTKSILSLAMKDNQTELCDKLKTFIGLLEEL